MHFVGMPVVCVAVVPTHRTERLLVVLGPSGEFLREAQGARFRGGSRCRKILHQQATHRQFEHVLRADFRAGDEDSNISVFRVRWFRERPEPLH